MTTIDPESIISILSEIPIFHGLEQQQLYAIVPLLKLMKYPPDTMIIKEGSVGDSMYVILRGSVRVTRRDKDKEDISLSTLHVGSYFGEFSLIDNLPRSANVISNEETDIFMLHKNDFDSLLDRNVPFANTFFRNCLTETFSRFRNVIANFTFSQHDLKEKSEMLNEINKDLSFAKKVQHYFINSAYIQTDQTLHSKITHSYVYHPCIEIGGDFLNIIKLDEDRIAVIIADVEGHGITASLATGVLKSAFSLLARECGTKPAEFMSRLNEHFYELLSRKLYATCYYALIDTARERISLAKAGHHHPFFWKQTQGDFLKIEGTGPGLGLIEDAVYTQMEFPFEKGDKLLFFTDGIIEQMNEKEEMYLHARLKQKMREMIERKEPDIVNCLHEDVLEYAGEAPIVDDITLLLFEMSS